MNIRFIAVQFDYKCNSYLPKILPPLESPHKVSITIRVSRVSHLNISPIRTMEIRWLSFNRVSFLEGSWRHKANPLGKHSAIWFSLNYVLDIDMNAPIAVNCSQIKEISGIITWCTVGRNQMHVPTVHIDLFRRDPLWHI